MAVLKDSSGVDAEFNSLEAKVAQFVGLCRGLGLFSKAIVALDYDFVDGEDSHTFTINPSLAGGLI